MTDIRVARKLPEDFEGSIAEGMNGIFSKDLTLILKMEDLEREDIKVFEDGVVVIDLLQLDSFKDKVGNIYALSVLIDGFIDNSEVMLDLEVDNLEEIIISGFRESEEMKVIFALVDEEDFVLAVKEFNLTTELSNLLIEKAHEKSMEKMVNSAESNEYIVEAFQKLFENEPEKNLELYSIGRSITK
ncbi:MAG: hypothetical protein ACRDD2_01030 [Sarcina sp.]